MDLRYVFTAGAGQFNVVNHSVSIDKVLEDPNLNEATHDKLLWVRQVRDYAHETLGLAVKKTYTTYYDTGDGPAAYNLSASRKDALEPYTWEFPVIGKIQYLGYFKEDQATAKSQELESKGYDVTIYGAMAYSTLGYFRDPVFSSILVLDKGQLAETVVHELTHNTIYCKSDSEFNESVASFVGQKGGRAFVCQTLGADCELLKDADEYQQDSRIVNDFMATVYDELNAFYSRTDLTSDEKIAQRDAIFIAARQRFKDQIAPQLHSPQRFDRIANMPVNNAWILLNRRYNKDMKIFEDVYQACNQDLVATIEVFKEAARTKRSYQYLTEWLAGH
jgi:predicted aminopeptidase